MLSTRNRYQTVSGFVLISIVTLVVIAFLTTTVFRPVISQSLSGSSGGIKLTSYNAVEASTYRYEAQARYYGSLAAYSPANASAYRYNAMARFYQKYPNLPYDTSSR